MTVSFVVRQLDSISEVESVTGTTTLYGVINNVLIDTYDHEVLLTKGQGLVSTQRRVATYIKSMFNNVVVPNKFINVDNNWALDCYTIVNESDVEEITSIVRDLINN